jgi:X-X-X-Leu-X-X-Gly heptad repeat protein
LSKRQLRFRNSQLQKGISQLQKGNNELQVGNSHLQKGNRQLQLRDRQLQASTQGIPQGQAHLQLIPKRQKLQKSLPSPSAQ